MRVPQITALESRWTPAGAIVDVVIPGTAPRPAGYAQRENLGDLILHLKWGGCVTDS